MSKSLKEATKNIKENADSVNQMATNNAGFFNSLSRGLSGIKRIFGGLERTLGGLGLGVGIPDRKSTRLNSSHANISYAVFCLKKQTATSRSTTRSYVRRSCPSGHTSLSLLSHGVPHHPACPPAASRGFHLTLTLLFASDTNPS